MPDKRDMHKAKSHRNSKSMQQRQQQPAPERRDEPTAVATATVTPMDDPTETLAPPLRGKKNKSRR